MEVKSGTIYIGTEVNSALDYYEDEFNYELDHDNPIELTEVAVKYQAYSTADRDDEEPEITIKSVKEVKTGKELLKELSEKQIEDIRVECLKNIDKNKYQYYLDNYVDSSVKLTLSDIDMLRSDINKVFFDFTNYLHRLIVCIIAKAEDENAIIKRINKIPASFESVVSMYCKAKEASGMAASLSAQIGSLITTIKAASNEDKRLIKSSKRDFLSNATVFCNYFSEMSSDWPIDSSNALYEKFVDLILESVQSRLIKNWNADIIAFDNCVNIFNKITDMIINTLVNYH